MRGAAALLALAVVSRLGADPVQRPLPAESPAVAGERLQITSERPLVLTGTEPGEVNSVLNIPQRMRYGAFVWNDEGVPPGPIWVRVDRQAQLISVFRGGHEIGAAVILYGAPEKPTPAGQYPILEKRRTHRSNLYDADMPFMMRLTMDGIAIHASDVTQGAATHGCIGLPDGFARKLFEAARVGDRVIIV